MPTTIVFTTKIITPHFSEIYVFVCGLDCTLTLFGCPRTDILPLIFNVVSAPPNPDLPKLRLFPCSLYTRPKELYIYLLGTVSATILNYRTSAFLQYIEAYSNLPGIPL